MWVVNVALELNDGKTKRVVAKTEKLMLLYEALRMLPMRFLILSGEKISRRSRGDA